MVADASHTGEGVMAVAMAGEHEDGKAIRPESPTITSRDTRIARA
jgi:hypothetical protein